MDTVWEQLIYKMINKNKTNLRKIFGKLKNWKIESQKFKDERRKEDEKVNYNKLIAVLKENRNLINVFYYVAHLDIHNDPEKYRKHEDFIEKLNRIPLMKVRLCNLKKIKRGNEFIYLVKGDDVRLAQDLLIGAFDDMYDVAIIVSGDEDFLSIIEMVRSRFKKKIGNAYFRSSSSYKLRKACDFSIRLNKILSRFVEKNK